jgi:hippurate hydrolase
MTYLREALTARVGEFIQLRRDIHRHPELAFEEHRTAELVASKLESWGYQVHRGLGGTGVVGTLKRGTSTRSLGLRADMDALPIQEASGAEWSSTKPGLMHACGHDGHTAMLLAAAHELALNGDFDGVLHLIFQPAEEGGGGALRMMQDGLSCSLAMPSLPCTTCLACLWVSLYFAVAVPWHPAITSPSV